MSMNISEMRKDSIGRRVLYVPDYKWSESREGYITGFDKTFVYVRMGTEHSSRKVYPRNLSYT